MSFEGSSKISKILKAIMCRLRGALTIVIFYGVLLALGDGVSENTFHDLMSCDDASFALRL